MPERRRPKLSAKSNGQDGAASVQSSKRGPMHDRMATKKCTGAGIIRIEYEGDFVGVEAGQRLLDAILDAGFDHRHICGGRGFCTSCRVEVVSGSDGLSRVTALERERLGSDVGRLRLACQTTVCGPAAVRVPRPAPSRFSPDGD